MTDKSHHAEKGSIRLAAERLLGGFKWTLDVLTFVPLLGLKTLFRFDRDVAKMRSGPEAMGWWADEFQLDLHVSGLENVPETGPMMLFGNHPTGIGDGIAMYAALRDNRPNLELAFLMNAQGLDNAPAIADAIVSVKLRGGDRANDKRELWRNLNSAVEQGRTLILFPAGRLSQPHRPWRSVLVEKTWKPGVISIPQRFPDIPAVPFRIKAKNSAIYYWLNWLFPFSRDLLLWIEFHRKTGTRYEIEFLPPKAFDDPEHARQYALGNVQGTINRKEIRK